MSRSPPVTPRWAPLWRMGSLFVISAILGLYCWNRSLLPVWVDTKLRGHTQPVGVTEDGRVVYLASPTRLIVRDVATGTVIAEHSLKQPCSPDGGTLSDDGDWARSAPGGRSSC